MLEHDADARLELGTVTARIEPQHPYRPVVRRAVAFEHLHGGRLAGAVRPEQREYLAGLHGERQVPHGVTLAVRLAQLLDLYRRRVDRQCCRACHCCRACNTGRAAAQSWPGTNPLTPTISLSSYLCKAR